MGLSPGIKTFTKITARSLAAWLKIVVPGGVFSFVCLLVSIILLGNNKGAGSTAGHAGGAGAIIALATVFATEFWSALLFITAITCLIIYIPVANKYALQRSIQLVWEYNLADSITGGIHKYVTKLTAKSPGWLKEIDNQATLKIKLMDEVSHDPEAGKIQKRILKWCLKRLSIDDINLKENESALPSILAEKIRYKIADAMEPSMKIFWTIFMAQALIMVLAIFFDHR